MEVKIFTNQNAKKYIKKLVKTRSHLESSFYNSTCCWLNESRDVKCYILCENENIKNMILLSKCDYDLNSVTID